MKDVIFEYHDVSPSENLEAYAKEKLNRIFNRYDYVIRADVFFKTENTSDDDTGMIVGIRLSAPGPRLFAESSKAEFRIAITESVRELERQLEKRTDKMKSY